MVLGLTMIKIRPGFEKLAKADLQKRPEIRDIYNLFGEFDFFLIVQAERRNVFNQILEDINAEEYIVGTGPMLFTEDTYRAYPARNL